MLLGGTPKLLCIVQFKYTSFRSFGDRCCVKMFFLIAGCLLTAAVLSYGLWCFRTGDMRKSQTMMRLRIGAQGFTLTALLLGLGVSARKASKKPLH